MHHTLFISDLHLEEQRPDITQYFFNFLATQAPQADALYILGDFFEAWIGDDECSAFQQSVIAALRKVTNGGLPIYLMRGNRDFLLGEDFMRASGCQTLSDPTVINLYDTPILLMHGDSLCTDDVSHQRFRRFTQNRFYQRLFLCLPLQLRQWIARRVRNASRERFVAAHYVMMDVAQHAVEQVMMQHQVDRLIHGHTHRPGIHEFVLQNKPARRIVLGDWHQQGSVLYVPEQGEVKLMGMAL